MMVTEGVEQIPLPAFLLDDEGFILTFNKLVKHKLPGRIATGMDIKKVFPQWRLDSPFVMGESEGVQRAFVRCSRKEKDSHLYIGILSSTLNELIKENKELKKFTRELDAIIENSYDGIYITDSKGVTWKTNSAIERITGIPKEYYLGKNVSSLMKRGILENSVTHRVVKQKRTVSLVQSNFQGKETLITGAPVFNEEGEVEKVVTNIRDLSELNELQAKLGEMNQLKEQYKRELDLLKNKPHTRNGMVIRSEPMRMVYDTAERMANVNATVLILGETGVGKDVLAEFIYKESTRSKEGQFIKINCGAIPRDLLESELFGYEKGAFTGASIKGKPGLFEMADKGVLFLDEIGELPLLLQVKLLRVLQEKEIHRIGGTSPRKVDVRIIAATNRNLKEMVVQGRFREDLYYRLNVLPISIPALRNRKDDILPLAETFLKEANKKYQMNKKIDASLNNFLYSYHWPGNIRELSNLLERLVITAPNERIGIDSLPNDYLGFKTDLPAPGSLLTLKEAAELGEKRVLKLAAEKYGSTYEIAKALESSQPTIVRKLKKYNLTLSGRGGPE
ncbi:sigma-54 interaction domain-containing protein [Halobacillus massiliensis]|uniref:sigma-54 interaction domain-containing protein n=1 Tax=Halobacillus massiliensis TaxID=1926286 RepID=UPI0009E3097F|nr:sigma 54-interacting transcriptional regulator [Halobacillus massiliensis]